MAYAISPKIGGDFICADECSHTDCAWNRDLIATTCRYCSEAIGENRWYNTEPAIGTDRHAVHYVCLSEHFDKAHSHSAGSTTCALTHD